MGLGQIDLQDLTELCYATRFGFYAPDQIGHMSLNGLRRRVATHDKTQIKTQMGEPSVALDLRTRFQLVGPLSLSFSSSRKLFVGVSSALGFFSMRHSTIFEEEVDFQEHCVGNLWVV
jgi:hypothetical protein